MTLANLLSHADDARGVHFIAVGGESFVSYPDLFREAGQVLYNLQLSGFKKGDELVFQLDDNREFITLFWACLLGGIVPVPLPFSTGEESRLKLENVWAQLAKPRIVCSENFRNNYLQKTTTNPLIKSQISEQALFYTALHKSDNQAVLQEIDKKDIAFIQYSSGSTGSPKGVVLTHENLEANIEAIISGARLSEEDKTLGWMPLTHDMGLIGFHLVPLFRGIDQYIIPTEMFVRRPGIWLKTISKERITITGSPNFGYQHFLNYHREEDLSGLDLSCLRIILNGAEPISPAVCRSFLSFLKDYKLEENVMFPVYGMAEACLAVTFPVSETYFKTQQVSRKSLGTGSKILTGVSPDTIELVNVGRPVEHIEIRVCDDSGSVLEEGFAGNIEIKGKSVTSGYYRNSEASAGLITDDWLKTGDIGFIDQGDLYVVGREKDVIFINGQNYFSVDVENTVSRKLTELENRVIAAGCTYGGKETFLLFIQHRSGMEAFYPLEKELKKVLGAKLSIVPDFILPVKSIPKTTSGKVQRFKLVQEFIDGKFEEIISEIRDANVQVSGSEGSDETENHILAEFRQILDNASIGPNDGFFENGGDSLRASVLIARLNERFRKEVSIKDIFKSRTPAELAALYEKLDQSSVPGITALTERAYYPVSYTQQRLLMLEELTGDSTLNNIPLILKVDKSFDCQKAISCLNILLQKHAVLRANFSFENNNYVQVISPRDLGNNYQWRLVPDLESWVSDFVRPFDFTKDLLVRTDFAQVDESFYWAIDFHHAVMDGSSFGIFLSEFEALYHGRENAENPTLKYVDYASWQRDQFKTDNKGAAKGYWSAVFEEIPPVLDLPQRSRQASTDYKADSVTARTGPDLKAQIHSFCLGHGLTPFSVFLGAYYYLLYRYSGQKDLIVGCPVAGRNIAGLEKVIGPFINTIPLRAVLDPQENTAAYLTNIQHNFLSALEFQDYPFEQILEDINYVRNADRNALFDVLFLFQNFPAALEIDGKKISHIPLKKAYTIHDLTLEVWQEEDDFKLTFDFLPSRYPKDLIEKFSRHFKTVLEQLLTSAPDTQIGELNILSAEEQRTLTQDLSGKENCQPSQGSIAQQWKKSLAQNAGSMISCGSDTLDFAGLDQLSDKLVVYFLERGVREGDFVGIYINRGFDMLASILALLKIGAAYVPMDKAFPVQRIRQVIEAADLAFIITDEAELSPEITGNFITLDPDAFTYDPSKAINSATAQSVAYVIFTSGSTGVPKGVMITHENVLSTLPEMSAVYGIGRQDKILAISTISFDISVLELINSLLNGNSIALATDEEAKEPEKILDLIRKQQVSVVQATPSRLKMFFEADTQNTLASVKKILVGGEALPESLVNRILELNGPQLFNVYGPTETTIWGTCKRIVSVEDITVGRPLPNKLLYVLNEGTALQPPGIPGEICIGGFGVARGYINNAEKSREVFGENPHDEGRLYRTGDFGYFREDGELVLIGRKDNQVKIRGYRIELGEVEQVILRDKQVKNAVVMTVRDNFDHLQLCAYIVGHSATLNEEDIRTYLAARLPEYMIPSYIILMDRFELNANGKVNKSLLPEPKQQAKTEELLSPVTLTEKRIQKLWQEVLELNEVGINQNFFQLGGHSLTGTRLIATLFKEMKVKLSLKDLFSNPTIQSLSAWVDTLHFSEDQLIEPVGEKSHYACSPAQERLYVLWEMERDALGYNMTGLFELKGEVHAGKVEDAFNRLYAKHAILRTNFETRDGEILQVVKPAAKFPLRMHELNPGENTEELVAKLVKPFDLQQDQLIRVNLIRSEQGQNWLLCDMHHIISDGFSTELLIREFLTEYDGKGTEAGSLNYLDYASWQKKLVSEGHLKSQEEYWKTIYADEPSVLDIPVDFARPAFQSFEGGEFTIELSEELSGRCRDFAKNANSSLYAWFLSSFKVLLSKIAQTEDVIVGTPVAGRVNPASLSMIGLFVNTLALRTEVSPELSFVELMNRVKNHVLDAYDNQDLPFEQLINELNLPRDASRNPLFDVMFAYQDERKQSFRSADMEVYKASIDTDVSRFDLSLDVIESKEKIALRFEFATSLFKKETVQKYAEYLQRIIRQVLEKPAVTIREIDLLTGAEQQHLLELGDNTASYPDRSFSGLIQESFELFPNNIALRKGDITYTYKELEEETHRLALALNSKGVKKGDVIALLAKPEPSVFAAMIALLRIGAVYLPVDTEYPAERIAFMLNNSSAGWVICDQVNSDKVPKGKVLLLDELKNEKQTDYALSPEAVSLDDIAYMIYTSGSTGQPKGVPIRHVSLADYVITYKNLVSLSENDKVLQHSSIAFDTSIEEIFPVLAAGGELVIPEDRKDLSEMLKLIEDGSVTVLSTSPLVLNYINEEFKHLGKLRLFSVGGDELKMNYLTRLVRHAEIWNGYGPTESTVCITFYKIKGDETSVPIGKPVSNREVLILGKDGKLLPRGFRGELCVAGAGLSPGYLNRPGLTAEKFVKHPFKEELIYKTGDLASWREDGNLSFFGRNDHQVKIRGFRIELGEIETAIRQVSACRDVAVIDRLDQNGGKYLCAYLVGVSAEEVPRDELKKLLADYMLPTAYCQLEALPLTNNGKLDRKKLPEPAELLSHETILAETDKEELVLSLWKMVLNREEIGVTDNFFSVGGDSIKAIQFASRLKNYNLMVEIRDIFQFPTVRELAGLVKELKITVDQNPYEGEVELLPVQLEFLASNQPDPGFYSQGVKITSPEVFDPVILQQTWTALLAHHDNLRSHFNLAEQSQVIGKIGENEYFRITHSDSNFISDKEITAAQTGIDLQKDPLVHLLLNRGKTELVLIIHHLLTDGISWRVLLEDFEQVYRDLSAGKNFLLPPKTSLAGSWATYLKEEYPARTEWEKEQAYWTGICQQETTSISVSPGQAVYSSRTLIIDAERTQILKERANEAFNTQLNDLLLTAFGEMWMKFSSGSRFAALIESHGRPDVSDEIDLTRSVGWFTSVFPVYFDFSQDDPGEHIKYTKEMLRNIPNLGVGYGVLRYYLQNPLVSAYEEPRISFNYLGEFENQESSFTVDPLEIHVTTSEHNENLLYLDVNGFIKENKLELNFTCNNAAFTEEELDALTQFYETSIDTIIAFCLGREEAEITQSDLTYEIDMDELDDIFGE
ncbi:MAG: amino acid adenylation domain protein [Crocinitomicaceae bacterium]|jgi:amino acid adenylation domain-containing protein/non-ribosomal peptide synthase protein (TIGR01720 family)|nr:amino acid adenylation domain protein [Crocinitomicaceae bacterium]